MWACLSARDGHVFEWNVGVSECYRAKLQQHIPRVTFRSLWVQVPFSFESPNDCDRSILNVY